MTRKHTTNNNADIHSSVHNKLIVMVTDDQLVVRFGTHGHTDTQHWTVVVLYDTIATS